MVWVDVINLYKQRNSLNNLIAKWHEGNWVWKWIFLSALKIAAWPAFHPCNSLDVCFLLCRFLYFAPLKAMGETSRKFVFTFFSAKKTYNKLTSKKKALLVLWNNRCCLWPWDLRANLFLFTCLEFLGFARRKAAVGNECFWKYMSDLKKKKLVRAAVAKKKWLFLPLLQRH